MVDPRRQVVGRAGARAVVAGRGSDEHASGVGVEEGQLDRVGAGLVPPEIEKLITLTPSRIACSTAAAESESKQPSMPQTLYTDTQAPGAMPLIGPRSTPNTLAEASDVAGRRARRVRAVAVAVAGRVDTARPRPGLRPTGRSSRNACAADQLVVADERVVRRRQRVVAEVAGSRGTVSVRRRRGMWPWFGERRVLGPGAGVEHAEDDPCAGPRCRRPAPGTGCRRR